MNFSAKKITSTPIIKKCHVGKKTKRHSTDSRKMVRLKRNAYIVQLSEAVTPCGIAKNVRT